MRCIYARNVHAALPKALDLLKTSGAHRDSRNGKVLLAPWPVTTVYQRPEERVVFWPERDANPFFHLYESLWMLAGRDDVKPLVNYAKNMQSYSDDGNTLRDAYGYRWRSWFHRDQLAVIAQRLHQNPDDRRCVLQMWDADSDLGKDWKSVPCNTMATFQVSTSGALDLTVFCRSNDIIWGAYGANAVQFGTLLEYMAIWLGLPVGTYTQVSVNWHAYVNTMISIDERLNNADPYEDRVWRVPMSVNRVGGDDAIKVVNQRIAAVLLAVDSGFQMEPDFHGDPFFTMAHRVLRAHHLWKAKAAPERYDVALAELALLDQSCDWVVAAQEWITRRQTAWERKLQESMSRGDKVQG